VQSTALPNWLSSAGTTCEDDLGFAPNPLAQALRGGRAHEATALRDVLATQHCDATILLGDLCDEPRLLAQVLGSKGPSARGVHVLAELVGRPAAQKLRLVQPSLIPTPVMRRPGPRVTIYQISEQEIPEFSCTMLPATATPPGVPPHA
jgi:hypothetical protein